jgi:hypothetical protein
MKMLPNEVINAGTISKLFAMGVDEQVGNIQN